MAVLLLPKCGFSETSVIHSKLTHYRNFDRLRSIAEWVFSWVSRRTDFENGVAYDGHLFSFLDKCKN